MLTVIIALVITASLGVIVGKEYGASLEQEAIAEIVKVKAEASVTLANIVTRIKAKL